MSAGPTIQSALPKYPMALASSAHPYEDDQGLALKIPSLMTLMTQVDDRP
jgi:hypothetical protein